MSPYPFCPPALRGRGGHGVSEHEQRIAQLEAEVAQWRRLFERMQEGFALCEMIYDAGGGAVDFRYLEVNSAWERLTGVPAPAVVGRLATEAIPGIEPYWVQIYAEVVRTGEPVQFERRLDALDRWFEVFAFRPDPGRFAALFLDVTARKKAEERQRLLLRELAHRVKNTLAVVQAIAVQTARRYRKAEQFSSVFQARLVALARSHDILTQSEWQGAPVDVVVREAMQPQASLLKSTIRIDTSACTQGLLLTSAQTLALGMALHELTTNAMKYGALSLPSGVIEINCEHPKDGEAVVEWIERGGPLITQRPDEQGFGLRLLTRRLKNTASVAADIYFDPEGVRCSLRMAKAHETSADQ